jgi:hypothetical protein
MTRIMRRTVGVVFLLAGLVVAVVGWSWLPPDRGRLEYAVQIVDPRPLDEAGLPAELAALGATTMVVARPAAVEDAVAPVLLLHELDRVIGTSDVALGALPLPGSAEALAGAATGVPRGALALVDRDIEVVGSLQPLGEVFDGSLAMQASDDLAGAFLDAGWDCRAQYLLPAESWEERTALLARLEADPGLVPAAGVVIPSAAEQPALSRQARLTLSVVLICCGLLALGWQLRGLSREDLARGFGRR